MPLVPIYVSIKIDHPNLGILEEHKHCWSEQLSFSVNTTAKSCLAAGAGFDDWNVSLLFSISLVQGDFLHWVSSEKLKYRKPRFGESTLT